MTEDKTDRIQQLKQRIVHWEAEQRHEILQKRDDNQGLEEVLRLSLRVAMWSSIPSVLWILYWIFVVGGHSVFPEQMIVGMSLVIYGLLWIGAARGSGLMAHWWFRRSFISEKRAAILICLLLNLVLFGWVAVLLR